MTIPTTIPGGYLNILLGDEQPTEAFTLICGLNSQGFTHQANGSDVYVPDCADPTIVATRARVIGSEQWDLVGSGLATPQNVIQIESLVKKRKHYRMQLAMPAQLVGFTPSFWTGYFILGGYTLTGTKEQNGSFVTLTGMNFASDGPVVFTPGTVA